MILLAIFFSVVSAVSHLHASRKLLGLDKVVVVKLSSVVLIDLTKIITDATLSNLN